MQRVKRVSSADCSKAGDTSQSSQDGDAPRNQSNIGDGPSVEVIETKRGLCVR